MSFGIRIASLAFDFRGVPHQHLQGILQIAIWTVRLVAMTCPSASTSSVHHDRDIFYHDWEVYDSGAGLVGHGESDLRGLQPLRACGVLAIWCFRTLVAIFTLAS